MIKSGGSHHAIFHHQNITQIHKTHGILAMIFHELHQFMDMAASVDLFDISESFSDG
jgi:hypothetical protein